MKLVISDPKTGKTYQKELDEGKTKALHGKKLEEKIEGDSVGLPGYELFITGGSDKQGFPMRKDLHGTRRKALMLTKGPGFHPKKKGERRRKSIRGNTVSTDIAQLNTRVIKQGNKTLEKIFGKEPEAEKKEDTKETPKKQQTQDKKETPKQDKKETPKKQQKTEQEKPKQKKKKQTAKKTEEKKGDKK